MLLNILLVFEVMLVVISFVANERDFLSPSFIMNFMFTISTVFALIFKDEWNINFQMQTLLIILIGLIISTIVDTIVSNSRKKEAPFSFKRTPIVMHVDYLLLFIVVIISIISVVVFYRNVSQIVTEYGYDTENTFEVYRLIKNNRLVSKTGNTPSTSFITNQLFRFTWACAYVSSFCVANNLNTDKKYHEILFHLIIIICASLLGIIEGARGGILQLLSGFIFDYCICLRRRVGWNTKLTKYFLYLIVFGVFCAAPLFYVSTAISSSSSTKTFFEYIAFYVGGSIALLNMYVLDPLPLTKGVFGEETFIGINNSLSQLGFPIDYKQVSLEFRALQENFNGNIYTFFRRPLHDFGFFGMLLCTALTTFIFSWIYHNKIKYNDEQNGEYWTIFYSLFIYWIIVSSMENYLFSISIGIILNTLVTIIIFILFKKYSTKKVFKYINDVYSKKYKYYE